MPKLADLQGQHKMKRAFEQVDSSYVPLTSVPFPPCGSTPYNCPPLACFDDHGITI